MHPRQTVHRRRLAETGKQAPDQGACFSHRPENTSAQMIRRGINNGACHNICQGGHICMNPHAGAELSIDDIAAMCDELIEAHGDWMPRFS